MKDDSNRQNRNKRRKLMDDAFIDNNNDNEWIGI